MISRRRFGVLTVGGVSILAFGQSASAQYSDDFRSWMPQEPSESAYVEYMAHLEDFGDTQYVSQPRVVGTRRQRRRLEGFQIRLGNRSRPLNLRYRAHLQGLGDVHSRRLGEFIGTRGESRRLEGFSIWLTGESAEEYNVYYQAHLQGTGDTGWRRNGAFCGTRRQRRRVEAMAVYISEKDA